MTWMRFPIFICRTVIDAPAREVFEWHERPEALLELLPSTRFIRILRRSGGLRDGGRVRLALGVGPLRLLWEAVHFGYVKGEQFCDEQVRGPFACGATHIASHRSLNPPACSRIASSTRFRADGSRTRWPAAPSAGF
jgi:ligand-binding SRPBCC domain-containing protein